MANKTTSTKAVVSGFLGGAVTVVTALQSLLSSGHVTTAGVSSFVSLAVATVLTTVSVYYVPNSSVVKDVDTAVAVVGAVGAGVDQAYDPSTNPAKNPPAASA